ncbi:carbohydrate ABC transporter permease [Rhizohabitans arisaemae]|uniref:carbohydrate ABC transporter permease n=1 Tax=Rhizohabitans arisaemae TaxID=2720610 RepID=UPI0024B1DE22|nr:sugar ABC transporter permease [Rhizohabitans arisaemae]
MRQDVLPRAADRSETPPAAAEPPRRRHRYWAAYLALLPTVALIGLFAYEPAINGIIHSFFTWRPGFTSTFTGLANYERMLTDELWWSSVANLGYVFVFGIFTWIVPFIAAQLVISLSRRRAQFVFRTVLILPIAFPQIVTLLIWSFMYHPQDGVLNSLLSGIGLDGLRQNWLGDPGLALLSLLVIGFPWVAGLPFLIFLTALQNIPQEIFEAAALDGAGRIRRIFSIDIPLMASQFTLLLFLAVISTLQYGMAAFVLTGGGPDNATQFPILRMLAAAFSGRDWGYAATLSTTLFAVTLVFGLFVLATQRRRNRV